MKKNKLVVSIVAVLMFALMVPMVAFATSPQIGNATVSFTNSTIVTPNARLAMMPVPANSASNFQASAMSMGAKGQLVGIMDIFLLDSQGTELQPAAGEANVIRIDIANLRSYDTVHAFHLVENADGTTKMEKISVSVYDNYITMMPTSFSLFGFYVERNAAPTTTTTVTTTSPQTGVYI